MNITKYHKPPLKIKKAIENIEVNSKFQSHGLDAKDTLDNVKDISQEQFMKFGILVQPHIADDFYLITQNVTLSLERDNLIVQNHKKHW